jgi:hypothetical protein
MRNEMLLLQGIKITAQPGFGLWKRMNYISFETTQSYSNCGWWKCGIRKVSFLKIERYCW